MAAKKQTRKSKRSVFSVPEKRMIVIRARYDAAQSTDENATLWTGADALSAAEANTPSVRKVIRERARYEVANNNYAKGVIKTLTNDTVGTAVQLQLGDTDRAQEIEQDFMTWASAAKLWKKLRTMRGAKCVDGEVFAMLTSNPKIRNDVKLDIRLLECDMVESWSIQPKENEIDGIRFDDYGNPVEYRVLKDHPGDYRFGQVGAQAGDWIKAQYIVHYFTEERPGQVRGVSELVSGLSLYGQLRKYTAAVVEAATRAAEITAVMQTDLPPDKVAAELADPVTEIQASRNAMVSLPEGWTMEQFKSEQPSTTYEMFKREITTEAARGINMPANVASGDSSRYNYASGRLDHQSYDRAIEVERSDIVSEILDRIYAEWLQEYSTRKSLSREDIALARSHEWHFSGRGHVDPAKEANADNIRFGNGSLTKAAYYGKQGKDWKREDQQWIRERILSEVAWNEARKVAGLDPAPYPFDKANRASAKESSDEAGKEPDETPVPDPATNNKKATQ